MGFRRIRWKRILRLSLFALLALMFLLPMMVAAVWAYGSVMPFSSVISSPDFDFPYETVRFTSRDGVELAGWYVPPQNGVVILLTHGYSGNRTQLIFHALTLVEAGYGVLLYDMRGHGESGGERRSWGWLEVNDFLGAFDYAQAQAGVERIGAFGYSVGGQVSLRAAANTPEIEAVVADGANSAIFADNPTPNDIADWIYTPVSAWLYIFTSIFSGAPQPAGVIDSLPDITPRPILLIATSINRELRQSTRYCEVAGENCTLWNIPETGHGGGWSARPQEYAERLLTFFDTAFSITH